DHTSPITDHTSPITDHEEEPAVGIEAFVKPDGTESTPALTSESAEPDPLAGNPVVQAARAVLDAHRDRWDVARGDEAWLLAYADAIQGPGPARQQIFISRPPMASVLLGIDRTGYE